jgi:hypothetical protein
MSRHKTRAAAQESARKNRLLSQKRVACIDYTSPKGVRNVHRILPGEVRFDMSYYYTKPQYLMRAYDIGEQKDRTFAMQHINKWWSEYLTPDDAPIDTRPVSNETRQAFKAAWYINAALMQPQEYLAACEERDWQAYLESQGRV